MSDIRHWCAVARYPGLSEFMAGTVHLDAREGESAARAALEAEMLTILPPGFHISAVLPGTITFEAEQS